MNMTGQASRVAAMSFQRLTPEKIHKLFKSGDKKFHAVPKRDGVRCLATTNGLHTKNGHPINALFHIQQNIFSLLYREYGAFDPHSIVLDGELYADTATPVSELLGAIKSHPLSLDIESYTKQQKVKYYVSDVFFLEKDQKHMPFDERQAHLKKILLCPDGKKLHHVHHVKSTSLKTPSQYDRLLESFIKKGSDGIVVYHPQSLYEQRKRSKHVWKFLPSHVSWFPISGALRDVQNGVLVQCLTSNNKKFTLTNRLNMEKRRALLRYRDLSKLEAKVQFYKKTTAGIPRFATIIGFRERRT